MSHLQLHNFDLLLSSYVKGTISGQMLGWQPVSASPDVTPVRKSKKGRRPPTDHLFRYRRLRGPDLLACWLMNRLDPSLWNFLTRPSDQEPSLLLTTGDFDELTRSLEEFEETGLGPELKWVPSRFTHEEYLKSVSEIRELLADTIAERFAKLSEKCIAALESGRLSLWQGIEIVDEWTSAVRRLLFAAGLGDQLPRPDGCSATLHFAEPKHPGSVNIETEYYQPGLPQSRVESASPKQPVLASIKKNEGPLAEAEADWPPDAGWHFQSSRFAFCHRIGQLSGIPKRLLELRGAGMRGASGCGDGWS